jgi:hypothetical protein
LEAFKSFKHLLQSVNDNSFEAIALQVFKFQSQHNPVYKQYLQLLKVDVDLVKSLNHIPFLPIQFFKTFSLQSGVWRAETVFKSSGTTSTKGSKHFIFDKEFYLSNAQRIFEQEYGSLNQYTILALLPSYLERGDSSLVAMISHFIDKTNKSESGFYLHNYDKLLADVKLLKQQNRKIIIWGVSYALLEIAEKFNPDWSNCLIFETGGMKGRRKEVTREELHDMLRSGLGVYNIDSEYGMTELLSQAYCRDGVWFKPSATLKVLIREIGDPKKVGLINQNGGINVVDLANFATISFIETEDVGKCNNLGHFQVLGRMDNSDVRGCNLLVQ